VNSALKSQQRDLIIRLVWQGEADLDLEVREPIGTLCSYLQRQSPGGGVLLGDRIGDVPQESYVAAKAFSGDYQITVRRVWGRPLGGKAVLEVIQHQGTPEETHRRETLVFDRIHLTSVNLTDGQRNMAEFVPAAPPSSPAKHKTLAGRDQVLNDLRALADGDHTRIDSSMRGATTASGSTQPSANPFAGAEPRRDGGLMYQTRVTPVAQTGVDVIAQVSMDAGGSNMRVTLSPVFQGVQAQTAKAGMNNPLLPGVFEPGQQD
jgi:hypothetical protein